VLDPLRDRRHRFLFEVNPNGAMADAQVINYETITRTGMGCGMRGLA